MVDKVAEKCEGIVERRANILGARGLETNGGVEATCVAVDVCRHEIICDTLDDFIWIEPHKIIEDST